MKLLIQILLLLVSPISAHTNIQEFTSNPITLEWQDYGDSYEYTLKLYTFNNDNKELSYTSEWINENKITLDVEEGSYSWELVIKEEDKTCEDNYQCFDIESGYFNLYMPTIETPEENSTPVNEVSKEKESNPKSKDIKKEDTEIEKNILGSTDQKEYIAKKEFLETEKSKKIIKEKKAEEIKSNDSNICEYTYNINKKEFKLKECRIDQPIITSSIYSLYNQQYIVNSTGRYQENLKIKIENAVCKNFNLLEPKTWLRCEEIVVDSTEYSIDLNHEVYFYKENIISPSNFFFDKERFEIASVLKELPTNLVFKAYFALNHREQWLDQELAIKLPITPKLQQYKKEGIYNFPFSKVVDVNQWHGCTAYQCPHTGIDFAAVKDNIYASDDGIVLAKGYDTFYGECNSGGNYLLVKYNKGHYVSYMHLAETFVKNNQKIQNGDLIAVSGNSGSYNCQSLGYHLHFELREKRSQSSHINPVPYIQTNWSLVKTNMSDIYPKRLSGDNPHPNF
jgi:hypothetical protein